MAAPNQVWSDEAIIEAVRAVVEEMGRAPTSNEWRERGFKPDVGTIVRRVGWAKAMKLAGVEPRKPGGAARPARTREQLIEELKDGAAELGHTPTSDEWGAMRGSRASEATVRKAFGSWPAGLEAAGLRPPDAKRRSWTQDEVLDSIETFVGQKGEIPSRASWEAWTAERPAYDTVVDVCGSWSRALALSGYPARKAGRPAWSKNEILALLKRYAAETGTVPTAAQWDAWTERHPHSTTVADHFGTWTKALGRAGLTPSKESIVTDQQRAILTSLQTVAAELGYAPTKKQWKLMKSDNVTYSGVLRLFGSWTAAVRKANIGPVNNGARFRTRKPEAKAKPTRKPTTTRAAAPAISDQEIIAALQAFAAEHDRSPTKRGWLSDARKPAAGTIVKRFGTWTAALAAADLETSPTTAWIPDEVLLDALKDEARRSGEPPTVRQWRAKNDDRPSAATIILRFGSWSEAMRQADVC